MILNFKYKRILVLVCTSLVLYACVKDRNFNLPENTEVSELVPNATYSEVKNRFQEETFQIQEDLIIEGYVTSSDEMGNFFSVLHFQDSPVNPSEGFQIEIDTRDSHLFFPSESKIYIKLKGLYLGKSKEVFKIGGVFTSFGNVSVGRLPATVVDKHIFLSKEKIAIQPTAVSIENLNQSLTNTLVEIKGVEIVDEELGMIFAIEREETERTLIDCNGNTLKLVNSGFSDFQSEPLPLGNGTITGVLLREKDDFRLVIRAMNDLNFNEERCIQTILEFTSNQLFISELADPNNNSKARFVELYNSASEPLLLNGWKLLRYTNDNIEVSSTIDLSGFTIEGESTFIISPNSTEFEKVYGFPPDMAVGGNSAADSNGDDNIQLIDPFKNVIDVFGVIGEDGSNTNHEFEDGRAVRNVKVKKANPIYTFDEWRIFNDTGDGGTMKETKNAPEDFTPGIRN
ncbi:lamin tail domain-containing protein [Maribacter algarum]|uniref:Lamin tail domain-containing protein n=1 Tax=Maribacter algarum (ex Zhang et al. 2020) TaxID=2578118 RepID=A0A5S3PY96_9FLAO|nr:DUF5689 domain-containing protein [Maribacter algarum]TMM59252.1 lamin tail domain-containing protein [Maribacter algarum]